MAASIGVRCPTCGLACSVGLADAEIDAKTKELRALLKSIAAMNGRPAAVITSAD